MKPRCYYAVQTVAGFSLMMADRDELVFVPEADTILFTTEAEAFAFAEELERDEPEDTP